MWTTFLYAMAASPTLDEPSAAHTRCSRRVARQSHAIARAEEKWSVRSTEGHARRAMNRAREHLVSVRSRYGRASARLASLNHPERMVDVYFITNREPHERLRYGIRDADQLTYGVATVRIPAAHPAGELERDLDIVDVRVVEEAAFHRSLGKQSVGGGLLTFVHGYNNSFDYAARRAAQVSHDLERPLVPVLFSWPTRGGTWFATAKYTFDENAAARSSSSFAEVLGELRRRHDVPNVLLAHSMGSRVTSEALLDLSRASPDMAPFERVVLAAPDMDAKVFVGRYLDVYTNASDHVTVYCANDDRALKLSRGVHGGYDRLGSCRSSSLARLPKAGVDVVDASMLYVDMVDHDKVVSSPRLLRDLRAVVDGVRASDPRRGLRRSDTMYELPP